MDKKEKEVKMMEKEIEKKKEEIGDLQSKMWRLESEIEFNEGMKKMGDIKPECWVEVETEGDTFVGYFHHYLERDGYMVPVLSLTRFPNEYPYRCIKSIKKVSQKVATDYIKRG